MKALIMCFMGKWPIWILNIQTSPFHIKEKWELEGDVGCFRIERIVHYPWSACHQGNGDQLAPISLSPTWSWFTIGRNCNTIRALLKKVLKVLLWMRLRSCTTMSSTTLVHPELYCSLPSCTCVSIMHILVAYSEWFVAHLWILFFLL